jgi:hypothetical protein
MTKYQPLADFLRGVAEESSGRTFSEIEETLGFPLPRSARRHAAWWSNHAGGHVQAKAWLDAGWQAWEVDMKAERVLFRRAGAARTPQTPPARAAADRSTLICIDTASLSPGGQRLLRDYREALGGDGSAALAKAVHEAAIARRGRLLDGIIADAPRMPPGATDSVDLVRQDRDAR